MDIIGLQSGGDGRIFQALQQILVKLLIGLKFSFENVVSNQELVEISHGHLFAGHLGGQKFLASCGS